jgi:hypothetical protein
MKIGDYTGPMLSHVNAIHRPEDRELAVELAEALGMTVVEVPAAKSGLLAVHPNPDDMHATRNVFYLAKMSPAQVEADDAMRARIAADPEVRRCVELYQASAKALPAACAHWGMLFPSEASLEPILHALRNDLSPELGVRVSVEEMPAHPPVAGFVNNKQVFIFTDVFTVGPAPFGQLIELQAVRGS